MADGDITSADEAASLAGIRLGGQTDAPASPDEGLLAKAVAAMREDPFIDDCRLLGTTQQDARIEHYARIALAALRAPAPDAWQPIADVDRKMTLDLDLRRVRVLAQCAALLSTMAGEGMEIDGHLETATLYDEAIMALGIEDADDVESMIEELVEYPEGAVLADRFAALTPPSHERATIVQWLRDQSDAGAEKGIEAEKGTMRRAAYGGGSLALLRAADAIEAGEHTPPPHPAQDERTNKVEPGDDASTALRLFRAIREEAPDGQMVGVHLHPNRDWSVIKPHLVAYLGHNERPTPEGGGRG